MAEVSYYTKEGLEKLKEELQYLKTTGRSSISKQIAEARDKGDLSENAEYDAAKEAQGLHEAKISQMQEAVANAIAKGLLGKKVGDTTEIIVPAGKMEFEILEISR